MTDSDASTPVMPDLRAPIVISVTGHRNILSTKEAYVENEIRKFLVNMLKEYPHTLLILQSALSPGMDQLATRVALELRKTYGRDKIRVRGVIPCDENTYKKNSFDDMTDGRNPSWWSTYEEYRNAADEFVQLPDMGKIDGIEKQFDTQLLSLSAFLISTSHILLAAWDGKNNPYPGGTGDTVASSHNGVDPQVMGRVDHLYFTDAEKAGTGEFVGRKLEMDRNRTSGSVSYLNIHEDSLIYHIPVARTSSDQDEIDKLERTTPIYYVPRAIYENPYEKDDDTVTFAYNDFGWKGTRTVPEIYTKLFSKVDTLNKRVTDTCKKYGSFEAIKDEAFDRLFGFNAYQTYIETVKELDAKVMKAREEHKNGSLEEKRKAEDKCLRDTIKEWYRLSHHKSAMIEFRISLWTKLRNSMPVSSAGWVNEHIKKLKKYKSERDANILKARMAQKYKNTRRGDEIGVEVRLMQETLGNAEIAKKELMGSLNPDCIGSDLDPCRYVVIDDLAVNDRDSNMRHVATHTVLTALTSLFLALYLIPNNSVLFTGLYVFFMMSAAAVLWYHETKSVQMNYLGYRLLAETLRVKVYWNILGISYVANDSCYAYLRNKAAWVRSVMTSWYTPSGTSTKEQTLRRLDLCESCWIMDQFQYHEQKAAIVRRKNTFSKNLALIFLGAATFLSLLSLFLGIIEWDTSRTVVTIDGDEFMADFVGVGTVFTMNNILKISVATANLLYAAMLTYLSKMVYGGNIQNMHTKAKMFSIAFQRCIDIKRANSRDRAPDYQQKMLNDNVRREQFINLFREIGILSIEEVNSWFAQHRTKLVSSFYYKYKNMY